MNIAELEYLLSTLIVYDKNVYLLPYDREKRKIILQHFINKNIDELVENCFILKLKTEFIEKTFKSEYNKNTIIFNYIPLLSDSYNNHTIDLCFSINPLNNVFLVLHDVSIGIGYELRKKFYCKEFLNKISE